MRFRPEDCYSKPTVARKNKVSNLVLKVKQRKIRKEVGAETVSGEVGGESEYQYSTELLGVVNSSYQFPGLSFFFKLFRILFIGFYFKGHDWIEVYCKPCPVRRGVTRKNTW